MRTCPRCGATVDASASACPRCHAPATPSGRLPARPPSGVYPASPPSGRFQPPPGATPDPSRTPSGAFLAASGVSGPAPPPTTRRATVQRSTTPSGVFPRADATASSSDSVRSRSGRLGTASSGSFGAAVPPEVEAARADPKRRFGRFLILAELGRGGMGVVYKAWDENLGRMVALKTLLSADPSAVERFALEAQAVARVRHPGIVSIHDAGQLEGRPYIAMDFIEGKPLDKRLKEDPKLPLTRGLEILRDVCRAVHHAHEQGVIHRDLKPQNVMLAANDRPYVLDFGLATLGGSTGLTRTGSTLGTPAYMPPEQAGDGSQPIDARSDVYALGATLYHVIAGRPPFVGPSEINVVTAVLSRDPDPPSAHNRRAVGDLDTICLRCLEKRAANRYQTAEELARELDRYLDGEPIQARPLGLVARLGRRLRRHAVTVAIAGVAALVPASALAWTLVAARLQRSAEERALAAARDRARAIREEVVAALDREERGGEVATLASAVAALVAPIADEARVRADVRAAARLAGGSSVTDAALDRAVTAAVSDLHVEQLSARSSRLQARAHRALGRDAEATREGARAYRDDPDGPDGALAFIEIGEMLVARREWRAALGVFRALASRTLRDAPGRDAARARIDLGLARAALGVGEVDLAWRHVRRARGSGALPDSARELSCFVDELIARVQAPATDVVPVGAAVVADLGAGPRLFGIHEGRVVAYRASGRSLERCGDGVELPLGASAPLMPIRTPRGRRLLACRPPQGQLLLLSADDERLSIEETLDHVLPPGVGMNHGVAAADLDGDGTDDLALVASPYGNGKGHPCAILDVAGRRRFQALRERSNVEWYAMAVADLDGDGKSALLTHARPWQGFDLRVLEWDGPFAEPRESFMQFVGQPVGRIAVGRRLVDGKPREHFVLGADRSREADAVFEDDSALAPGHPDAIYELGRGAGAGCALAPVYTRSFALRRTEEVLVRASWPLPHFPDALLAEEVSGDVRTGLHPERKLVFLARSGGVEPVVLGFPERQRARRAEGPLGDLDGDGEPEWLVGAEGGVQVCGLRALGTAPDPGPPPETSLAEPTPLDVALDLLACGEVREARLQLEKVLAGTPSAMDRAWARLALARAFAADGRLEEAARTCRDLAQEQPRVAHEALLIAAAQDERRHDYAAATRDLETLRERVPLTSFERSEVDRRLTRVRPLANMTECLRIDAGTLETGTIGRSSHGLPLGLELGEAPQLVSRTERGLRVFTRTTRPEGHVQRRLIVPLEYGGGSVRMRVKLRVQQQVFGGNFEVNFVTPSGFLRCRVECRGGGSMTTWSRAFSASCPDGGVGEDPGGYLPDDPVVFELSYLQSDERVDASVRHRDVAREEAIALRRGFASGPSRIEVVEELQTEDAPACYEIEEVVLWGEPGDLRLRDQHEDGERDPARRELLAASALWRLGSERAAARAGPWLDWIAASAGDPEVRRLARLWGPLARARAGDAARATDELAELLGDPASARELYRFVYALDERERAALRAALARRLGDPKAVARELHEAFSELVPRVSVGAAAARWDRFDRAGAYALSAAIVGAPDEVAGLFWYVAGDRALADRLFGPEPPPPLALAAGRCALELERYRRAVTLWQPLVRGGGDVGSGRPFSYARRMASALEPQ